MNTASNKELEDFEESTAPERFELSAPSNNTLLPDTNASVRRTEDSSVVIDWPKQGLAHTTVSSESVFEGIEQSVRRNIVRFPHSARAHANLGIALLKKGQTKEAYEELTMALEIDPHNYLAGLTIAGLHLAEGRIEEAQDCYQKLVQLYPDDAAAKIGLSIVLIRTEKYDDAYIHLSNSLRNHNRDPFAHFLLGLVCIQKSDIRSALNAFRAAANLNLRNPDIYHAIGVAYTLQGEHVRAERAFKTALNLAPESPATVISLSRTLLEFHKWDQAIEILQEYLDLHKGDLGAQDQLAFAYMQAERYSSARSQISQILAQGEGKLSPDESARHRTNIAVTYMRERSFKRAEGELKSALQLAPQASHIPYENLARVYALTKRIPLAIGVLQRAVELFPSNRGIRSLLSIFYADQEQYWMAIRQLEILQREGALSDENYACLGDDYLEVGESGRAIEVLMEGYSKFPKSMNVINNLAYCLLEEDRVGQAKEVLNSRPRNEVVGVEMTATLGLLNLKEGDYDAARRLYKRAENMATKSSRKELARRVRQKMHLELARYYAARGKYDSAHREIRAGQLEKMAGRSFARHLEKLAESIKTKHDAEH